MKKLSILLFSVVAMGTTIVSCTDDKDNNSDGTQSSSSLVGTWKIKTVEEKMNGQSTGALDPSPECTADGKISTMTFKSDNTYSETDYDSDNDCTADTYGGTYTLSSDKKTITLDGEAPATIVKLTSTDLQVKITETDGDDTMEMIVTFKK